MHTVPHLGDAIYILFQLAMPLLLYRRSSCGNTHSLEFMGVNRALITVFRTPSDRVLNTLSVSFRPSVSSVPGRGERSGKGKGDREARVLQLEASAESTSSLMALLSHENLVQ